MHTSVPTCFMCSVSLLRFTSQTYGDKLSEVLDKKKKKVSTNEVLDDDDGNLSLSFSFPFLMEFYSRISSQYIKSLWLLSRAETKSHWIKKQNRSCSTIKKLINFQTKGIDFLLFFPCRVDDEDAPTLSVDQRLKVIAVLAARSPRSRTPLPTGLRTEHSLVELRPLYDNEAAVEVRLV